MPLQVLGAMVALALLWGWPRLACSLVVGFAVEGDTLYETSELMAFGITSSRSRNTFTILCFLFLINSFNYLDGLDGLLGSLSIVSIVYFTYFSYGELAFFLISIIIYLVIFLFFNMGVLPKQFMGDSGSLGLGFLVSFLATYLTQVESSLEPSFVIWPLAFFVYEFISINLIRIKIKKNIFSRDLMPKQGCANVRNAI